MAEISRKLYRQGNADAVMSTSANEIGAQWKVSRCLAALAKPKLPPSVVREYCGEWDQRATPAVLAKVAVAVQELAVSRGS